MVRDMIGWRNLQRGRLGWCRVAVCLCALAGASGMLANAADKGMRVLIVVKKDEELQWTDAGSS